MFSEVKKKPVPAPRTRWDFSQITFEPCHNLFGVGYESMSRAINCDLASEVNPVWSVDSCDVFTQTDCGDAEMFSEGVHRVFNRFRDNSYYDNNHVPNCNLAEDSSDFSGLSPDSHTGSDFPDSSIDSCRDSLISSSDSIDNNCILGAERMRVGECLNDFEGSKVMERRTLLDEIRAELNFDFASLEDTSHPSDSPEYRTKSIGSLINFFEGNQTVKNYPNKDIRPRCISIFSTGNPVQERVFREILDVQARETNSLSSSPLPETHNSLTFSNTTSQPLTHNSFDTAQEQLSNLMVINSQDLATNITLNNPENVPSSGENIVELTKQLAGDVETSFNNPSTMTFSHYSSNGINELSEDNSLDEILPLPDEEQAYYESTDNSESIASPDIIGISKDEVNKHKLSNQPIYFTLLEKTTPESARKTYLDGLILDALPDILPLPLSDFKNSAADLKAERNEGIKLEEGVKLLLSRQTSKQLLCLLHPTKC